MALRDPYLLALSDVLAGALSKNNRQNAERAKQSTSVTNPNRQLRWETPVRIKICFDFWRFWRFRG